MKKLPNYFLVAIVVFDTLDDLIILMALACNKQCIVLAEHFQRLDGSRAAINLNPQLRGRISNLAEHPAKWLPALQNAGCRRSALPRRTSGHGLAHEGALGAISIAAAAKYSNNAFESSPPQGLQNVFQRVWRVGVVYKYI